MVSPLGRGRAVVGCLSEFKFSHFPQELVTAGVSRLAGDVIIGAGICLALSSYNWGWEPFFAGAMSFSGLGFDLLFIRFDIYIYIYMYIR
jgi:hypothetical protein